MANNKWSGSQETNNSRNTNYSRTTFANTCKYESTQSDGLRIAQDAKTSRKVFLPEKSLMQESSPINMLYRWVPALGSLRGYSATSFRRDLVAGVTVAAVAVPQAIAYAKIFGMPAEMGLYKRIAPGPQADAVYSLIRNDKNQKTQHKHNHLKNIMTSSAKRGKTNTTSGNLTALHYLAKGCNMTL